MQCGTGRRERKGEKRDGWRWKRIELWKGKGEGLQCRMGQRWEFGVKEGCDEWKVERLKEEGESDGKEHEERDGKKRKGEREGNRNGKERKGLMVRDMGW